MLTQQTLNLRQSLVGNRLCQSEFRIVRSLLEESFVELQRLQQQITPYAFHGGNIFEVLVPNLQQHLVDRASCQFEPLLGHHQPLFRQRLCLTRCRLGS